MRDSETALEHLKVIRGLMEKATIYRTVTVPTAFFGGGMALVLSLVLWSLGDRMGSTSELTVWLLAFAVVNAFHHGLIFVTARKAGDSYPSPGLNMALKTMVPPLFVGGLLGIAVGWGPLRDPLATTLIWITFYGLALLATHGFSPRSLRVLGMALTLAGSLTLTGYLCVPQFLQGLNVSPSKVSALAMGVTFGLGHLIYGISVKAAQRTA